MKQTSEDGINEASNLKQKSQSQKTPPSDVIISASEIEKLYLRIKEDWL